MKVTEYRFDRDHNSYFRVGQQLRDRLLPSGEAAERIDAAIQRLGSEDREARLKALKNLAEMGLVARSAAGPVMRLAAESKDEAITAAGKETLQRIAGSADSYSPEEVKHVQELSALRATASSVQTPDSDGRLKLVTSLTGNGAAFLVITPEIR